MQSPHIVTIRRIARNQASRNQRKVTFKRLGVLFFTGTPLLEHVKKKKLSSGFEVSLSFVNNGLILSIKTVPY